MVRLPDCQIDFHTRLARLGTLPDWTRLGEAPDCQIGLAARLPDWPSYQIARLAVLPDWQSICRHFCSSSGQIVSFWNQIARSFQIRKCDLAFGAVPDRTPIWYSFRGLVFGSFWFLCLFGLRVLLGTEFTREHFIFEVMASTRSLRFPDRARSP